MVMASNGPGRTFRRHPLGSFHRLALLIGMLADSVVLTWMCEGTRSSILVVALWHPWLNLGSATTAGEGTVSVVTMFVIAWSIVIARAWRRRGEDATRTDPIGSATAVTGSEPSRAGESLR
jgi:hypothetical protein